MKKGEKGRKCLNEEESLSYEQQIIDNNRQLARLRTRNEELEIETKALRKKFEQLQEDRDDVVAHLKHDLEEKAEETRELTERLSALEELRKEELEKYKKKEKAMEFEYKTMKSNLTAEVKLTAGKLSALDDWRLNRIDLMKKFEIQEEEIAKQKELHTAQLYETEKSVIIAKAKMQEEMQERLEQLAERFKRTTSIRIADVVNSTVSRNIALNQELNSMLKVCEDLELEMVECKEHDRMLRLESELRIAEAKIAIDDTMKNKRTIDNLAQTHIDKYLLCGKMKRTKARFNRYKRSIKAYQEECAMHKDKIKILEQQLDETVRAKEAVLVQMRIKCKKFKKVNDLLSKARQSMLEALEMEKHICTDDICALCSIDQKQKIVYSLQSILEEHEISDMIEDDDDDDSRANEVSADLAH